jgi:hypothetical protein
MINHQTAPAAAREMESYELAEAVNALPQGYFHPGMSEEKQRQLAVTISASALQSDNRNTPGAASTSMASFLC